jgi:UDPglucose 6-dehydrogenase
MQNVCVIGTGYVGLVTGACLADFGNHVICVEKDKGKLDSLKSGHVPFHEFGLEGIMNKNVTEGRLSFTDDLDAAVKTSGVVFITVGTPMADTGEADLSQVFEVAAQIARNITEYKVVVQKSTVPVGTGAKVKEIIEQNLLSPVEFDVASNPEFLREGAAVENFMRPDRVVIGTWSKRAEEVVSDLYRPLNLNETPMVTTTVQSAELIKYASNAFLATKISFVNEMANLCEVLEADIKVIERGMGLDRRIGRKFLHAGAGYGGSCFPKDTQALAFFSRKAGNPIQVVEATTRVNDKQRMRVIRKLRSALEDPKGKVVGVLGLSFKPETDDVREAVALDVIKAMVADGATVKAFDPVALPNARLELGDTYTEGEGPEEVAEGADALVIATEWNEFRRLNLQEIRKLMRSSILVDCKNIYDPKEMNTLGFHHIGIGRGEPVT